MSRTDTLTEKAQEVIFNDLLSRDENQQCADCDNKTPTWCSIDFGIFICMRCAGVHRQLGPHITRVRSTKLDSWKKENIEILAHVGNKIANDFYEAKMPNGYRKPNNHYTMAQVAKFVDEKYIKKLYVAQKSPTPVEEFKANRKEGIVRPPTLVKEQSETTHNHPKSIHKIERKRSLSMEPNKEEKMEPIDLLSAADDLLSSHSKGDDLFGDFSNDTQQKETKKINFDGFKNKNQQQQQQQVQSSNLLESNTITTNPVFQFSFNGNQQVQQTQQQNQQLQFQQNQQLQQQNLQQNQQQQLQNTNNNTQPDLMKLYSQTNSNTNTKGYGSNNVAWNELNLIGGGQQQQQLQQQNGGFNNGGGMNSFGYSSYNQSSYGYGNYQNNSSSNFGGFNTNGYGYGQNGSSNGYNGSSNYSGNGFNGLNGGNFNGGYSNQGLGNFGGNLGSQNVYNNNNFMKLN